MKKNVVRILTAMLMLSVVFSSSVFAAEKQQSAWDSFVGLFSGSATAAEDTQVDGITYRTHIQNDGWAQGWVSDGKTSGSEGRGLRLEGIEIKIDGDNLPADLGVTYRTQIENDGWLGWETNGDTSGSVGQGLRLEAIEIKLTGDSAGDYSVGYKTHIQNYGWEKDWSYNGDTSGTVGEGLRLEGIQIEVFKNIPDLTAYNAALAAVKEADYTTASWAAYQTVVKANVVTTDNLVSEVEDATTAITAAQANLVKVLKVESVSAINAHEILVTFSQVVSKGDAETTGNYTFNAANSSAASITVSTAKLQDDKKSVVLTLGTNLNNKSAASYLCNIKNVTDVAGVKTVEYSQLLNLFDAVAPTVTGITYPDSNTIKVAFSEPINTISTGIASATTIKLDGTTVVVPSGAYTLADDKKSFTINIATSGLVNSKNYAITIDGLTDFASNALVKFVGTITFAPDTTNPTVTNLAAIDLSHIKVTFSEPIKNLSPYFAVKIAGLNSGNPFSGTIANANTTTPDYKTFIFTMTSPASVAAGNQVVTINNFQDTAGNPTNVATSTYTQELAFAVTKPALTSTVGTVKTVGGSQYVVYSFDRDVLVNGTVAGTYVKDSVTNTWTSSALKDSTTLGIEKNEIAIPAPTVTGNYTVTLQTTSVRDVYSNAIAKTDVTFVYGVTTPATVTNVAQGTTAGGLTSTTVDYVTVTLSKEVSDNALDYTKYTVDGVQVFNAATFITNKTQVRLTLKPGAIATSGSKTFAVSGISDVTDISFDGSTSALTKKVFAENVKPLIQKVELTALNTVRLTFSENLATSTVHAADFEVKVNGSVATTTLGGANSNVVTLTLSTPLTTSTTPVTVAVVSGTDITDTGTPGNLTPEGQLTTATVALSDTKGIADAALTDAVKVFTNNGTSTLSATLATGKTAAQARTAYNAAVTAVANHGVTSATVNLGLGATPTYAQTLAWLKGAVLMAEAEDFSKTADLTLLANYNSLDSADATSFKSQVATAYGAMPAANTLATTDSGKADVNTRNGALFTTEKGLLDTALANYASAATAKDTAIATTTKANIDAAKTAFETLVTNSTALTLSDATEAKMISDAATYKTAVKDDVDFTFTVSKVSTTAVKVVFAGTDVVTGLDNAGGYTVAISNTYNTGVSVPSVSATGTVAITNMLNTTGGSETITITNNYWGKTNTKGVTITSGSPDTFAVNADV